VARARAAEAVRNGAAVGVAGVGMGASALPQASEWPEQAARRDRRGNAFRYVGEELDTAFPGGAILPRWGTPELTIPAALPALSHSSQRHTLRALRLPLWVNRVTLTARRELLLFSDQRTSPTGCVRSEKCHWRYRVHGTNRTTVVGGAASGHEKSCLKVAAICSSAQST
jgi:hypothetical protein